MKIKKGYKWKSIEGPAKGKEFTVIEVNQDNIIYRSEDSYRVYIVGRKEFDKYIQRVNKYWNEKNKSYKRKKEDLRNQ